MARVQCVKCHGTGKTHLGLACSYCKGDGFHFADDAVGDPEAVQGMSEHADKHTSARHGLRHELSTMVNIPLDSVRIRVRGYRKTDEYCDFPETEFADDEIEGKKIFDALFSTGEFKIITMRAIIVDVSSKLV